MVPLIDELDRASKMLGAHLKESVGAGSQRSFEQLWDEVHTMVHRSQFAELAEQDQLRLAQADGSCLALFREGPLDFMPTFKVERGQVGPVYLKQRIPSWCDRILHYSLPGVKPLLEVIEPMRPVPELTSSDHKPMRASFKIWVPKPMEIRLVSKLVSKLAAPVGRRIPHFSLSYLTAKIDVGSNAAAHLYTKIRCVQAVCWPYAVALLASARCLHPTFSPCVDTLRPCLRCARAGSRPSRRSG